MRLSVGKYPADANNRRLRKEAELNAMAHGAVIASAEKNGRSLAGCRSRNLDGRKGQTDRRTNPPVLTGTAPSAFTVQH